ncbi:uteroglobin [Ochotona curzoniae]|uniref:uteroglobin n=1 Tax=Ochotona curzoniae TaxID=130825 RepID=UPI001B350529|nr:uteroglobin [Ochotona curzoniae]
MKLAITFVLAMLALYCSPASAGNICPAFAHVIESLLLGVTSDYETSLKPFNLEDSLKDSGMQMKKVLDTLPQKTREDIMRLTEKIVNSPQCA